MHLIGLEDPLFKTTSYVNSQDKYSNGSYVVYYDNDRFEYLAKVVVDHHRQNSIINAPLDDFKIIRAASCDDIKTNLENYENSNYVTEVFNRATTYANLDIKYFGHIYSLDKKKIKIYFYSTSKVDFRELIKQFLRSYKGRIKLQLVQVQGREYAALNGGIGLCGLELCCHNLKYNKPYYPKGYFNFRGYNLNVKLNVDGYCGGSMCCSLFEVEDYLNTVDKLPDFGTTMIIKNHKYICVDLDLTKRVVKLVSKNLEPLYIDFDQIGDYFES